MTNQEPKVQPQPVTAFKDTANKSVIPLDYEEGAGNDTDDFDEDYRPAPALREQAPEEPQA